MALTWAEARARAAVLSGISYAVDLDLTGLRADRFTSRTEVRFTSTTERCFLELQNATDVAVTLDGVTTPAPYDGDRICLTGLPTGVPVTAVVTARLPYVTSGEGMHRFTDPADDQTYVSAYCGMDIAHRVFACFDQNDLKAPMSLTVSADPEWTVLGNGVGEQDARGRWRFSTTPAHPVALFVVCAGPWASVTWEHTTPTAGSCPAAGTPGPRPPTTWPATPRSCGPRPTRCWTTTTSLFDAPYPFDSCDQIFVPGLNWGAQENSGCVTYRDEMLPRGRTTDPSGCSGPMVIAHEQAHMWFGNLVTMRWFEDTWLQESFADYFGPRVAEDGAGFAGARVPHEVGRKADGVRRRRPSLDPPGRPAGRGGAGRRRGADQLRRDLLRQGQLGAAPAGHLDGRRGLPGRRQRPPHPARVRQRRPGRVRRGARRRLGPRRDGVGCESWLRTSGFDTVRVTRDGDVPVLSGRGPSPPAHRDRLRRRDAAGRRADGRPRRRAACAWRSGRAGSWCPTAPARHSRGCGSTSARGTRCADRLAAVDDPMARSVLWSTAFDLAHTGEIEPAAYVDVVAANLGRERHASIVASVLGHLLVYVMPHRMTPRKRWPRPSGWLPRASRASMPGPTPRWPRR